MKHASIIVRAEWDEEAQVWVATSTDIDGLAVEAATVEEIKNKVMDAIRDLLELNGIGDLEAGMEDIPVHIMSQQMARIRRPQMVA